MTQEESRITDTPSAPDRIEPTETQTRRSRNFSASSLLLHQPRLMLGAILMYAGMAVYLFFRTEMPLSYWFERYGTTVIAATLGGIGFYLFFSEFTKWRLLRESKFVDVDERSRVSLPSAEYEQLATRLSELQATLAGAQRSPESNSPDPGRSAEANATLPPRDFVVYFDSIRRLLEQKAAIADEKASILLDKGTTYSRFGIMFFIFCIVAWQVLSLATGFQMQYVYGIISTSLLFIFIEFLSAWFLKQYRQFIDTSTYLIKVKSIFDRYMLVYLASKEAISDGHDAKKSTHLLLDLLRSDISWPDTYLTKNPDISFAKEALETMTLLVKSMKSEATETMKKETASSAKRVT